MCSPSSRRHYRQAASACGPMRRLLIALAAWAACRATPRPFWASCAWSLVGSSVRLTSSASTA
eukprot:15440122-Alexandrium_andersonii.AAC.1